MLLPKRYGLDILCLFALLGCASNATAQSFERDIAPLLTVRCLKCRSGATAKGDLDLTNRAALLAGGASGVVLAPKASDSLLLERVREKKMPPKHPLSDEEIDLLRLWIDAGAVWKGPALKPPRIEAQRAGLDWWALQPIRRPAPPAVSRPAWVRTPIDAFILGHFDKRGIAPAPEADRHTFIQRVTIDPIGLRPSPEEIDAFVGDSSTNAYRRFVGPSSAGPRKCRAASRSRSARPTPAARRTTHGSRKAHANLRRHVSRPRNNCTRSERALRRTRSAGVLRSPYSLQSAIRKAECEDD